MIKNTLTKQNRRIWCFHWEAISHGSKINDSKLLIVQEEGTRGNFLILSPEINEHWRSSKLLHC